MYLLSLILTCFTAENYTAKLIKKANKSVVWRCSIKNVYCNIPQISNEKSCNFIKKDPLFEISKSAFFTEHPPPLTPSSPGDWCFCIQYSYRHVWKSKSLRSDIINKKQLFIGDLENSFVKFFVKFLEKHQFPINFEIFFRTAFSNNTSRWLLLVWSKIHFDDIYKL